MTKSASEHAKRGISSKASNRRLLTTDTPLLLSNYVRGVAITVVHSQQEAVRVRGRVPKDYTACILNHS
jgi:hypothetical protein